MNYTTGYSQKDMYIAETPVKEKKLHSSVSEVGYLKRKFSPKMV